MRPIKMLIMSLLGLHRKKKNGFGSYTDSTHVELYERIAADLQTTPQHVYEIAHGKLTQDFDDTVIRERLRAENILS